MGTARSSFSIYTMPDKSFPARERLKSQKAIRRLFSRGNTLKAYPVLMRWLPAEDDHSIKAGFSAPRKKFKLAVERNRIKRLLRETYRREKTILHSPNRKRGLHLMFIYLASKEESFQRIRSKMKKLLLDLADQLEKAD